MAFFCKLMTSEIGSPCTEHQVIDVGGKNQFKRQLGALTTRIRESSVGSVGVLRDADENATGAFQSVADALGAMGFAKPTSRGEVVASQPRVGVFVMPDGQSPGALEALCRQSVADSPAGLCVEEYMHCLTERDGWEATTRSSTAQKDKAFVHAYLASRRNPVVRTGEGALQGVWDLGHHAFRPVTGFLRELIAPPAASAPAPE